MSCPLLSSHYPRVTLLERDPLPASRDPRRGVPQGRHTHGLLGGGREALESLFPGLTAQLVADGAIHGDILAESRWFFEGGCHCQAPSGLLGLLASRPFLESAIRERVRALTNVTFRDNAQVVGLLASPGREAVTGVQLAAESLAAGLTVDTTGRGARSLEWLEELGYPKPAEERVVIDLKYTTRLFRRNRAHLNGDSAVIIGPTPSGKRGGVMLAQEGERWTVTLISHFGPGAPQELDGFLEFARTLPSLDIHHVLSSSEPLGEALCTNYPASVRRRFERLTRFPEGYLVMGDALSSFNPIYGQGMTVAAQEALELDSTLAESPENLARRFFRRAAKVVDVPWSIAAGNDLRMPEATGHRTLGVKLINAYIAKVHKAAQRDPEVAKAFHRVGNLLAPPPSLMHPRIATRVFRGSGYRPPGL